MAREPILVVDDNLHSLLLAQVILSRGGYEVKTAVDAEEALTVLKSFTPRLILMDLQLPGMDGQTLTRQIKADPSRSNIIIIALTAYAVKGDEERVLAAGCDGCLAKPIDIDALLSVVGEQLTRWAERETARCELPPLGTGVGGSGRKKEPMLEPSQRSRDIVSTKVIQTSVVLVEGNRLLREGLVAMVGDQEDLLIVGALANRDETLAHVRGVKPDVVLIDLGLRKHDDERLVEALTGGNPGVKVIVMDMPPGEADIFALIRAGVSGFILKDASFDEFLTTIRLVISGTHVLPPPLADTLFSEIANQEARYAKTLVSSGSTLTKREREIIMLIADGLSNKEIALRLNVATFTVKSHVHNVLEKLTLRTRLQIASYYTKESATVTAAAVHDSGKGRYDTSK